MSTTPKQRRTLLRAIAMSGAALTAKSLPEAWTRPLVQATMLPAHAQATGAVAGGVEFSDVVTVVDATDPNDPAGVNSIAAMRRGLMNRVLPSANAVNGPNTSVSLRTIEGSPDSVDVRVIREFGETDISVFERSNVPAGSFVDIDFIGNTECFFGDYCRVRVLSIEQSIMGVVDVNGYTSQFEASPGPWPGGPSLPDDCEEQEPS